jgi:hypothetical protein
MRKRKKDQMHDPEIMLLNRVDEQLRLCGFLLPRVWTVNFLVAFKSKPLMILIGPREAEKEALVESYCHVITGGGSNQYQPMVGHPWWASQTADVAMFTQTQSRLNTIKLEMMNEEAGLPGNRDQFYIANIKRISPGELQEYFSETAFQLRHGELMRLPTSHFSNPVPFPPNLAIIGTMDTLTFPWSDADLLSQTTVIDCAPTKLPGYPLVGNWSPDPLEEKRLIQSYIRDPQRAFRKLMFILRRIPSALFPLLHVQKFLQKVVAWNSSSMLLEGMIYLSNSWSQMGSGLFDENPQKNLQIAMDLAITQSLLLPNSEKIANSKNLRDKLQKILDNQYPLATNLLSQLAPA